jgi:N-acetyl-anhydromuramyl-L-alanine amidase AmpD
MVKENLEFKIDDSLVIESKCKKEQIILTNTLCSIDDFLTKIKLRYNKKYNKVPAYTIDRSGTLYFHFNTKNRTNFFDDNTINEFGIAISLENVGWLDYIDQKREYVDWRGITYSGNVMEKSWRGKRYWADYTNEQMETLLQLIDYLCITHSINKNFIGNNVFVEGVQKFKGILNRSNLNKNYHDLTPAFDFDKLTEKLNK